MSRPIRAALLGYEPVDCWDALDRECTDAIRRHRAAGRSAAWCYAWLLSTIASTRLLDDCGVWALAADIGGWERCADCGEYEWDCTCDEDDDNAEHDSRDDVTDHDYRAWHRAVYGYEPAGYEGCDWVADSMSEGGAP